MQLIALALSAAAFLLPRAAVLPTCRRADAVTMQENLKGAKFTPAYKANAPAKKAASGGGSGNPFAGRFGGGAPAPSPPPPAPKSPFSFGRAAPPPAPAAPAPKPSPFSFGRAAAPPPAPPPAPPTPSFSVPTFGVPSFGAKEPEPEPEPEPTPSFSMPSFSLPSFGAEEPEIEPEPEPEPTGLFGGFFDDLLEDDEEEEEPEPEPPAAPPSLLDPETSAKIGAGLTGALGGAVIGDAALTAANVGLTGELITDAALIGAAVLGGGAIYAANRPDEAGEAARFVGGSVANVTSAYVELAQVNAELALLEKQREARAAIDGAVADVQATPGRVASDAKKGLKSTVRGVRDAPGKLWSNVKGTFGGAPQEEEE